MIPFLLPFLITLFQWEHLLKLNLQISHPIQIVIYGNLEGRVMSTSGSDTLNHIYSLNGTYSVKLISTGIGGVDTLTRILSL